MNEDSVIKVGICGYGNLGKGVELALEKVEDMELKAIFTRRNPDTIFPKTKDVRIVPIEKAYLWKDKLDVVILCGGSKEDIPKQLPEFSNLFNTVNTFDTHSNIQKLYETTDTITKKAKKVAVISTGWDPGLFSKIRKLGDTILPNANYYTFWGPGVSQGHSDAIRAISGVKNAIQYTIPNLEIMEKIKKGEIAKIETTKMHERDCYVAADKTQQERIEQEIKKMPTYFEGYKTTVHFVTEEEIKKRQQKMQHEGWVICVGETGKENRQIMEFHLALDSNPEFTGAVALAYARAAIKLQKAGEYGAKTVTQICIDDMATKKQNDSFKYI